MEKREISFGDHTKMQVVVLPADSDPLEWLKTLGIPGFDQLLVIIGDEVRNGGGDDTRLDDLGRAILGAALDMNALVVTAGTASGFAARLGRLRLALAKKPALLGVAADARVTYPGKDPPAADAPSLDPNHPHVALVLGDGIPENDLLLALARTVAASRPVMAVLVGGGPATSVLLAKWVAQPWPVLIATQTGGLADQIAGWRTTPPDKPDRDTATILRDGDLRLLPQPASVAEIEQIALGVKPNRNVIEHAWRWFAKFDTAAVKLQTSFRRFQNWILILGIVSVVLALGQKQVELHFAKASVNDPDVEAGIESLKNWLAYPMILAPILVTLLLTLSHRFRPGNRWVLLRSSAETIRREIYAYRLQAGRYGRAQLAGRSATEVFRDRIETFTRRLMQSEVNRHALNEYDGKLPPPMYGAAGKDDGFSPMTPDAYIAVGIGDQLSYYAGKSPRLERDLRMFGGLVLVCGAAGTVLAAVKQELWIGLTTALTTGFTTYLKTWQVEETLVTYNQCAADLQNLRMWWEVLPPAGQRDPANIERLLELTEKILEAETAGWAQRMSDVLAELRKPETEGGGAKPVNEPPKSPPATPPTTATK